MIRVMNSLLTEIIPSEQKLQYYPYLHFNPTDEWDHNRRFQSSLFPSSDTVHISKWLKQESFFSSSNRPRFTVQSGDFLSVYSPQFHVENSTHSRYQENSFDAVVTSFFLDTGTDLIDYLITIHYLLRSGGIWVNSGPLHYHSVTDTPYSYAIIRELIQSLGFVSLENTIIESSYCGEEENFMKPEYYRYPLEVWQLEKSEYPSLVPTYPLSAENDSQRFVLRNFGTL